METFIAVCLGILVVETTVVLIVFVSTLLSVRQAVRAVEVLTYRVDDEVDHFGTLMRSGWLRALQGMASVAAGFWSGRRRD